MEVERKVAVVRWLLKQGGSEPSHEEVQHLANEGLVELTDVLDPKTGKPEAGFPGEGVRVTEIGHRLFTDSGEGT